MIPISYLPLLFSLPWAVSSLQVTPGSECAALCLDKPDGNADDPAASSTGANDIVCRDSDYSSKPTGIKFKNCLECLQDSPSVEGDESDALWYLYNIRFAVDVCLYGFPRPPDAISSPCDIDDVCGPLGDALTFDRLRTEDEQGFGYCNAADGTFTDSRVEACYQCLQTSPEQNYLANFMIALNVGCQQTPEPGTLLGLHGSLFSQNQINVTDPPTNATLPPVDEGSATGMNTGTIVGIVVGAALLLLGAVGLFFVHRRRERRFWDKNPDSPDYDIPGGRGSGSAQDKDAFVSVDSKPRPSVMSHYELKAQKAYSNNAEFYDDLEKKIYAPRTNSNLNPNIAHSQQGSASTLPAHPAYVPSAPSRASSRTPTPEVLRPVKYHKPDSWALQQYLDANEDAASIHLPPPPRTNAPSSKTNRSPSPAGSSNTHLIQAKRPAPPPPPPNPGKKSKVPSLVLPSVPQIRVPKRYSPPQIHVSTATPIDISNNEGDSGISKPMTILERRFQDRSRYGGDRTSQPPLESNENIVEQQAVVRPSEGPEAAGVPTGKSAFYG